MFVKVAEFRLPLAIDTAFPMLLFYAIGNWMRGKDILNIIKSFSLIKNFLLLIVCGVFCLVCYFINGETNVRQLQFNHFWLYVIGAIAGCMMMIVLSMIISDSIIKKFKVYQGLLYIGKGTIIILYVHSYILEF